MSTIKKNYIYNIVYQVINIIIPLLLTPYLSRVLGVENIGIYSYNFSIVSYFMMFSRLGIANYGVREISKVRNNDEARCNTFWQLFYMQLMFSFICLILYLIFIGFKVSQPKEMFLIMIFFILSSMLDISWFFFGIEEFKITMFKNSAIKILSALLIFSLVKTENDILIYALILSISSLLSSLFLWTSIKKHVKFVKPDYKKIKENIKPNLVLFLPIFAISLYEVMDKIMIGIISNKIETGLYESANKVIRMPIVLFTALGTVMLPRVSGMISENKEEKLNLYLRNSMQYVVFLSMGMIFGLVAVANRFVPIYFGNGYEKCISLMMIMSPVILFSSWKSVIRTQCLIPKALDKTYIISVFLGAIINLIINLLLIPKLGAVGAAIGTLISEFIVCIYQTIAVRNYINVRAFITDNYFFIIPGLLMWSLIYFVLERNLVNNILNLLIMILVGFIVYISLSIVALIIFDKKRYQYLKQVYIKNYRRDR